MLQNIKYISERSMWELHCKCSFGGILHDFYVWGIMAISIHSMFLIQKTLLSILYFVRSYANKEPVSPSWN